MRITNMINYSRIKTAEEFEGLMEELYFPRADQIEELTVPIMKFIVVGGKGSPESPLFQQAIQSLYGIAFGIKMGLKFGKLSPKPVAYFDFKVPPLEGLWWQGDGKVFNVHDRDNWQWQVMILMPPFVDDGLVEKARQQAAAKHPEVDYSSVKLEEFKEGKTIQTMHIGPYATEPQTIQRLMDYIQKNNYRVAGRHHEIYMADPRRTTPEKLKTVLRYPVK